MKEIENIIIDGVTDDSDYHFNTSDDEIFKRAVKTANVQQGSKDMLALGMASIWVVFVSIFMKILKPVFNNMAKSRSK